MAMEFDRGSAQSLILLIASRRWCSLDDSIFDKMFDSRELGRNTFPMACHLLLQVQLFSSD